MSENHQPGNAESITGPPPRLQDRYRLVERLGEGSMGVVYRAYDETLDRDVAIKFLSPERVAHGEASARFLREARAVARLSHPNIVTLYDVGYEDQGGWHYLVLEHIPGQDLNATMIERGAPLPVHEALHAIRGTLSALAFAHARFIVHRDIKPENIMITPDGQVKVTDFGLALAWGDVRLTKAGMIVGTVLYMAPETITGAPVDPRADLYAVGAVLYELLTGQPPFAGDDPMAILSQALNVPVAPPRTLEPGISQDVERIVVRLLAKDPDERYGSAEDVLAALSSLAESEGLAATATQQTPADRVSLPLLERIVRGSSSTQLHRPPTALVLPGPSTVEGSKDDISAVEGPPAPDEETLLTLHEGATGAPPHLAQELLVYAAIEDTTAAVETERRRLATLLQSTVVEPLNLLLSQANAYEQTIGTNPTARMAVSVLASLARQALQQVRDVEANLYPIILESLGLEPALEGLASQAMRTHGLQISLALERMRERLPPQIELALYRTAQEALDRAIRHAHASQVTVRLERHPTDNGERLVFCLSDNGVATAGGETLRAARRRIEQLGGIFETTIGSQPRGGFELTISFAAGPPIELTPREMEVIQLLVEGLSNKEIARLLFISPRTVNFHLDNIYSKLGVSSRTEAAIYALRHGWVRRSAT